MGAVQLGNDRILAPGKCLWLRAILWAVALIFLVQSVYTGLVALILRGAAWIEGVEFTSRADADPLLRMMAVFIACAAAFLAYRTTVSIGEKRKVTELDLGKFLPEMSLGLVIGGLWVAAILGMMWAYGAVSMSSSQISAIYRPLELTVRSGFIEELVMRLIFFRVLWRAFGIWPAFAIAALLFGALHMANPGASALAAAGLILGEGAMIGLYLITGRVWMSVGAHAGWNFMLGWIFGATVSGTDGFAGGPIVTTTIEGLPDYLTGGEFGAEASLACMIVSVIVSAGVMYLAWQRGAFEQDSTGQVEQTT